jgi:hypothetical protein
MRQFVIALFPEIRNNRHMGELASRVLQQIEDAKNFDDIKDWIWMAGDLIRHAASPEFYSGFKEIDREDVSEAERKALQEAALRALTRNSDPGWVGSFLSVLRDAQDRDLMPLWIDHLSRYLSLLKNSNGIVFTILLALKDLDEPVFENAGSLCIVDIERNVTEAFEYLRRHNIIVPG